MAAEIEESSAAVLFRIIEKVEELGSEDAEQYRAAVTIAKDHLYDGTQGALLQQVEGFDVAWVPGGFSRLTST